MGRKKCLTIGEFPYVSIQDASQRVSEHKSLLAKEIDPSDQRETKTNDWTFRKFAKELYLPHVIQHKKTWEEGQYKLDRLNYYNICPLETELRHSVSLIQKKIGRFIMLNVTAEIQFKVPFYDIDVKGIVWHGNYLRYFEEARAELLDKIGYGYFEMKDSGYAWPVVDARVQYIKPLHLQQHIKVLARLVEYERQVKIDYEIFDLKSGERTTKGYTTQVAVNMSNNELCFASPKILLDKLGLS